MLGNIKVDPAENKDSEPYQSAKKFFDVGLVFFTIFAQTYAPQIKQSRCWSLCIGLLGL